MTYWMIATFALYVLGVGMTFAVYSEFEEMPDTKEEWVSIALWPVVALVAWFITIAFAVHTYRESR